MPGKLAGILAVAIYGSRHIRVYFCPSVSLRTKAERGSRSATVSCKQFFHYGAKRTNIS